MLFHNGTWGDWRENLRHMLRQHRPAGLLSDTRIAASIVDLCGTAVLDRLPGRWVFFDRDFTEPYGDWREWQGMRYRKGAVAIADMHMRMRSRKEAGDAA